jgi:hypothetical protein
MNNKIIYNKSSIWRRKPKIEFGGYIIELTIMCRILIRFLLKIGINSNLFWLLNYMVWAKLMSRTELFVNSNEVEFKLDFF